MATQPEPVLSRATIVTVISVLAALLVKEGSGSVSTWLEHNEDLIASIILAVGPLVSAFLSRRKVTPVDSPKDAAGQKLVPAGSAPATLDAANVLAEMQKIAPQS